MNKKSKFLFCICTRNRPRNLIKTVNSIIKLYFISNISIKILVVENEKKRNLKNKIFQNHNIKIVNEKKIGISNARNRCLKEAKNIFFDYLVFIDDDCTLDKNWIKENLVFLSKNQFDIITGPQISKNNYYLNIIERKNKHNSQLRWASTNNVLIKKKVLNQEKIQFNTNLQHYGGEDQLFFWKLSNKGYKIGWNSYSKVYEKSSKDRLNFYWFIKRSFGYGCSASHIYKEIFRNYSYLFLIIKIFYDLTLSIFYLILLPISPKKFFFKKIHHLARALGCAFSTFLKYNLKRY